MWFYYIGMVLLGISTGFLVANSMTPIAGILLPLLFSLIGGGAGVYILKLDPSNERDQKQLTILGAGISCFFAAFLLSMFFSISIRYESVVFPLESQKHFNEADAEKAYHLLAKRKRLQILGATPAEQEIVLNKIMSEPVKEPLPEGWTMTPEKKRADEDLSLIHI